MHRGSLRLLRRRLSQVPILGGDAADNAMQRQPQVQARPAAQHALAHVPCTLCWVSLLLQQRQSGASCKSSAAGSARQGWVEGAGKGRGALTVPNHWHRKASETEQTSVIQTEGAIGWTCSADCASKEGFDGRVLGGRHERQHGALAGGQALRRALQRGACDRPLMQAPEIACRITSAVPASSCLA